MRVEISASYLNQEQRGVEIAKPIIIQTGENSYTTIPTQVGERLNNTDILVTTAGIRYGATKDTEIYARASALGIDRRATSLNGTIIKNKDGHFTDAWVGLNHRFRNDIDHPALLGFAELQVAEKRRGSKMAYGKSLVLGGTTYQTYDPVVLSLTTSIQLNAKRKQDKKNYHPGHNLTLSPSVGFAVNDEVTLTTGLGWRLQLADKLNGEKITARKSSTSLNLGLGYAFSKKDTLNLSISPKVSGEGDVQIKMNWIHQLDKK